MPLACRSTASMWSTSTSGPIESGLANAPGHRWGDILCYNMQAEKVVVNLLKDLDEGVWEEIGLSATAAMASKILTH